MDFKGVIYFNGGNIKTFHMDGPHLNTVSDVLNVFSNGTIVSIVEANKIEATGIYIKNIDYIDVAQEKIND